MAMDFFLNGFCVFHDHRWAIWVFDNLFLWQMPAQLRGRWQNEKKSCFFSVASLRLLLWLCCCFCMQQYCLVWCPGWRHGDSGTLKDCVCNSESKAAAKSRQIFPIPSSVKSGMLQNERFSFRFLDRDVMTYTDKPRSVWDLGSVSTST